jgi:hypothetical protein
MDCRSLSDICSSCTATHRRMGCKTYNSSTILSLPGSAMSDAYIYYFMECEDATGENTLSKRPATLEAIKGKGEPIMESQIVVDDSELDGAGYLNARDGRDSYEVNDLSAQIWSLEVRAASRDIEASKLTDGTEGKDKYMLSLESRELRGQARKLKSRRRELLADQRSTPSETGDSAPCGGSLVTA